MQPDSASFKLCAVLVLYKTELRSSCSYQSLLRALSASGASIALRLLIYDNSPTSQECPDPPPGVNTFYRHDPSNGGLTAAYNFALTDAATHQCEWLLLLDQDTTLPADYLNTFLAVAPWLDSRIACVLPKMRIDGTIMSPRHTGILSGARLVLAPAEHGVAHDEITGINSASFVNVAYLRRRGGYNKNYWLDGVDFWFFADFYRQGMKAWVLNTTVDHELSTSGIGSVSIDRYQSITSAEADFQIHMRKRPARVFASVVGLVHSAVLLSRGHRSHARVRVSASLRLLKSALG